MPTKTNDQALRERAERVIPNGMYGHMAVRPRLPEAYPQFFERADGCRLWDVDGNEYIDFICAYGPMIAGYGNPRIRAAADAQRERLDMGNGPPAALVEFAEKFTRQVSHAEWAVFAKNGNDATTVCNMIARGRASKRKILVGETAYHGSQPWANRMSRGTPEEEHVHYPTYRFNDIDHLTAVAEAASGDLAGIVVSTFRHDVPHEQELVDPAFARKVREICDAEDAALILDDVRGAVWQDPARVSEIGPYRRALQRTYLERLESLMTEEPPSFAFGPVSQDVSTSDMRPLAREQLRSLRAAVSGRVDRGNADRVTLAHLQDVLARIEGILEPGSG